MRVRISDVLVVARRYECGAEDRNAKFTALLHHVTVDRLRESFLQLQKKAAPGVDGVTWEQYAKNLEDNVEDLHARLHRGAYRAKPPSDHDSRLRARFSWADRAFYVTAVAWSPEPSCTVYMPTQLEQNTAPTSLASMLAFMTPKHSE
jgi:hypothetical protein